MSDSVKCTIGEFTKSTDDWLGAFPLADHNQRTDFYYNFKEALKALQYFEVLQGRATVNNSPMLYVAGAFYVVKRHEDMVMLDLQSLWNQHMVKGSRARHAFTTTDTGFGMHFAVTPSNSYIMNGVLQVTAKR